MSKSDSPTTSSDDAGLDSERTLGRLHEKLDTRLTYIQEPELKRKTAQWLKRSTQVPSGDVVGFLDDRMTAMNADYTMHDHDGVDDPTDAFPDACKGCPHYGGGCPVATQRWPQNELTRIADGHDGDEFKRRVRKLANLHNCHRLPEWLREWDTRYRDLLEEGWDLFMAIEVDVGEMDQAGAQPKVDLTEGEQ